MSFLAALSDFQKTTKNIKMT